MLYFPNIYLNFLGYKGKNNFDFRLGGKFTAYGLLKGEAKADFAGKSTCVITQTLCSDAANLTEDLL
jgi:hypothetical protein